MQSYGPCEGPAAGLLLPLNCSHVSCPSTLSTWVPRGCSPVTEPSPSGMSCRVLRGHHLELRSPHQSPIPVTPRCGIYPLFGLSAPSRPYGLLRCASCPRLPGPLCSLSSPDTWFSLRPPCPQCLASASQPLEPPSVLLEVRPPPRSFGSLVPLCPRSHLEARAAHLAFSCLGAPACPPVHCRRADA